MMGYLERLRQRQAQEMEERRAWVELARTQWLGCTVMFHAPSLGMLAAMEGACVQMRSDDASWVYGEVVEVSDYGEVRIAYAVGQHGEVYYKSLRLEDLGTTCLTA